MYFVGGTILIALIAMPAGALMGPEISLGFLGIALIGGAGMGFAKYFKVIKEEEEKNQNKVSTPESNLKASEKINEVEDSETDKLIAGIVSFFVLTIGAIVMFFIHFVE